jgi:hypothetical protein
VVVHWHATRQFGRHKRDLDASQLHLEQNTARVQTRVMSDAHMEIDDVDQANNDTPPPPEDKPSDQPKGKAATKPTASLVREPGKSLLPISRVQKIMKADKVRAITLYMQGAIFDIVLGAAYGCKGGRVSYIIGNRRVHQEAI